MTVVSDQALDLVMRLREESVETRFQRLVDLRAARTVAFEAFSRGPVGSSVEHASVLFAAAREAGRVAELDRLCRRLALSRARMLMPRPMPLFVNIEPESLGPDCHLLAAQAATVGRNVVFEIRARDAAAAPAVQVAALREARATGCRFAIANLGANDAALELLQVIRPDVVKVDIPLMDNVADRVVGRTMSAVTAYAERSNALVVAERVESAAHLERALALGATVAQGWLLGRPTTMPRLEHLGRLRLPMTMSRRVVRSPFNTVVANGAKTRVGTAPMLAALSRQLEALALEDQRRPVLLAAFQAPDRMTRATRRRYSALGSHCTAVAAFSPGLGTEPAAGVRGVAVDGDDPLRKEWCVVVLGTSIAGALLARDLGHPNDDGQAQYRFTVTHDRQLVELAAESLLTRLRIT